MKLSFLLLFSLFFYQRSVFAAACCGGGFAMPSIIAGDDKAVLTSAYFYTEVVIDNVDSKGVWRSWNEHQRVQNLRIDGAHIFYDRWQAGFSLPVIQRTRMSESYSGLGDISTSVGYEYLPDWNYNPYRPKGIGYLQLTLPTGKSKAESEIGGLDSRGNGFWALGLGTLLTKNISSWDAFASFEVHRSFEKKIATAQIQGTLKPSYGGASSFGGGYNTRYFRYGGSISWVYEDAINIEGGLTSKGSIERYAAGTFTMSYLASEEWASSISYSDQTLFGSPINTSLGKTIAFQLQRRWSR